MHLHQREESLPAQLNTEVCAPRSPDHVSSCLISTEQNGLQESPKSIAFNVFMIKWFVLSMRDLDWVRALAWQAST
jgi:hypothetical protein